MRVPATIFPPTIFETLPRVWKHQPKSIQSISSPSQFNHTRPIMASTSSPSPQEYDISETSIPTASGVTLTDSQKLLTGCVLDLFAGKPSLRKLSLWADDAVFEDPLTVAEGRKQYQAQWYGLNSAFSNIQRLHCEVVSSGNPIEIDLKSKYKVKVVGSEQTIESRVNIYTSEDGKKITKVQDKWNGQLPDGAFKNAMRNLNSVVVPAVVHVPKSIEEEESK